LSLASITLAMYGWRTSPNCHQELGDNLGRFLRFASAGGTEDRVSAAKLSQFSGMRVIQDLGISIFLIAGPQISAISP
jgi:hypothetical protein